MTTTFKKRQKEMKRQDKARSKAEKRLQKKTEPGVEVVGNDGIVGIALFMGGESTPSRAVVPPLMECPGEDRTSLREFESGQVGPPVQPLGTRGGSGTKPTLSRLSGFYPPLSRLPGRQYQALSMTN